MICYFHRVMLISSFTALFGDYEYCKLAGPSGLAALRMRLRIPKHQRRKFTAAKSTQKSTMSHLSNPLATASQLYKASSSNALPIELQDSIRFYTARLTQAAGILLRLPQDITAQANVLLFRYWLVDDLMAEEFCVCLSIPN